MPEMGKYADVILSAYGLTAILIGVLVVISLAQARKSRRDLAALETKRKPVD